MQRGFLFGGGSFYGLYEAPRADDLVIAADAGYQLCKRLGIEPDLLIGDFDSMERPADAKTVITLPVEKDDTDTVAAARLALERGCKEIYIYGGTGGRLDHTLANLQLLLLIRRRGAKGWLYDDRFLWTVAENEAVTIHRTAEWGILSLFPMDGPARGITLRGVQYPLTDAALSPDFPLGVSNHILEDTAQVICTDGVLAVGWELLPPRKTEERI